MTDMATEVPNAEGLAEVQKSWVKSHLKSAGPLGVSAGVTEEEQPCPPMSLSGPSGSCSPKSHDVGLAVRAVGHRASSQVWQVLRSCSPKSPNATA